MVRADFWDLPAVDPPLEIGSKLWPPVKCCWNCAIYWAYHKVVPQVVSVQLVYKYYFTRVD